MIKVYIPPQKNIVQPFIMQLWKYLIWKVIVLIK